ncbi:uncharacterized protein LOC144161626 [Haemaphysalis longicornis]
MPGNGEGSLVLSIVGVRLGLLYMRRSCTRGWALGRRINSLLGCCRGACQLAPSLPSRRCPGGAEMLHSLRFSALALFDKSGHLFEVPNPKRVQACPCSVQACNPSRRQNMTSSRHVAHTPCFNCENKRVF